MYYRGVRFTYLDCKLFSSCDCSYLTNAHILFNIYRRIILLPNAFDSGVKFLEKTRKSFGGETFTQNEAALLEWYHSYFKEEYYNGSIRRYYAAFCIGKQALGQDYWCLSGQIT